MFLLKHTAIIHLCNHFIYFTHFRVLSRGGDRVVGWGDWEGGEGGMKEGVVSWRWGWEGVFFHSYRIK